MRKFWVLLALAAMVAAGCKSGKQTEVKEECAGFGIAGEG